MTHLELYLDCLKLVPNEVTRTVHWISDLDKKSEALNSELKSLESELLSRCSSPSYVPTVEELQEIRYYQAFISRIHAEKSSLSQLSRDEMMTYVTRLDEEMKDFELLFPDVALSEVVQENQQQYHQQHGQSGQEKHSHSKASASSSSLSSSSSSLNKKGISSSSSSSHKSHSNQSHSHSKQNSSHHKNPNSNSTSHRPPTSPHHHRRDFDDNDNEDFNLHQLGESLDHQMERERDRDREQDIEERFHMNNNNPHDPDQDDDQYGDNEMGVGDGHHSHHGLGGDLVGSSTSSSVLTMTMQDEGVYCFCQTHKDEEMIGCDGKHCKFQWFHLSCVGLKKAPPSKVKFYCQDCKK